MIRFSGRLEASAHKTHQALSFDLPPGVTRLAGRFHATPDRSPGQFLDNMICLSLWGPAGGRGARHNNPDRGFEIEATRATPGFLPGPPEPGHWTVSLDIFRLLGPIDYRLEIEISTTPQPAAAPRPRRSTRARGRGWYRGDLHSHTFHSDGSWSVADLVTWARASELDFLALTDHNTTSGHAELQALASDDLLTIGGMELTTHHGHAVTHGAGLPDWRGADAPRRLLEAGRPLTIAHPMAPGDEAGCTGCRWGFADLMPGPARQVELWNGGPWSDYNEEGLALFRSWLNAGHRLVATAGSDIHGPEGTSGPIGFNHVEAEALTEAAVLAAVAAGRNYLSSGPQLILTAGEVAMGGQAVAGTPVAAHWRSGPVPLTLNLVDATGLRRAQPVAPEARGVVELSGAEAWVMAELRDARGTVHALSNPIFLQAASVATGASLVI